MIIIKNTVLKAGNHLVSIGKESHFVAILSPNTNKFVELKRVKRKFKFWLSCSETFCFERLSEAQTLKLIQILK